MTAYYHLWAAQELLHPITGPADPEAAIAELREAAAEMERRNG